MARARELHDAYFKLAKAQGYAARSAFKLLEIQERRKILRGGNWVLDLGCAPGSWLQVASKVVGPKGRVVGVDLSPVTIDLPPNVYTAVGDAFATSAESLLAMVNDSPAEESGVLDDAAVGPTRRFNVVISDMAPNTTGTPQGDHFRSITLCRRVVEIIPGVLQRGGHLVMKVYEGESYPELLRDIAGEFGEAKGFRPDATRDVSREIFIVGTSYRGAADKPKAVTVAMISPSIRASVPAVVLAHEPKPTAADGAAPTATRRVLTKATATSVGTVKRRGVKATAKATTKAKSRAEPKRTAKGKEKPLLEPAKPVKSDKPVGPVGPRKDALSKVKTRRGSL